MADRLSTLGSSELIRCLTEGFKITHASTLKGIGDAAVLRYGNAVLVVTTATLAEGVHFDLIYTPMQHLGYKAAVVALSGIYAMNAAPRQMLVSIAASAKFSVESLKLLYQGLQFACEEYGVDLAGGDTSPSVTGLYIHITAVGEADAGQTTGRHTAQKGDLICVSGDLGGAYMGVQVLEREKKMFEQNSLQPNLDNYAYVVGRQLKPHARKDIVEFFASSGVIPTAMTDVSHGLSGDLLHICTASDAGCEIHHHKIPIADETVRTAEEFYMEPLVAALNGGCDYELLFTVPVSAYEKIIGHSDISIIGYITGKEEGCFLMTGHGNKIELKSRINN
ncbi:MAG: thiamine-phosphate kinase [Bacteroidales bacterium]|jgi:thiamine-monophosphate kinase|nr:thiamine-phosphate kinase [Bacteroidales bacterium]